MGDVDRPDVIRYQIVRTVNGRSLAQGLDARDALAPVSGEQAIAAAAVDLGKLGSDAGIYVQFPSGERIPCGEWHTTHDLRVFVRQDDLVILVGVNPDGSWAVRVLDEAGQVAALSQQPGRVLHVRRRKPGGSPADADNPTFLGQDDVRHVRRSARSWAQVQGGTDPMTGREYPKTTVPPKIRRPRRLGEEAIPATEPEAPPTGWRHGEAGPDDRGADPPPDQEPRNAEEPA